MGQKKPESLDQTFAISGPDKQLSLFFFEKGLTDTKKLTDYKQETWFPLVPVIGEVIFPGAVMPLVVKRDKDIEVAKRAYESERLLFMVAQKNQEESPKAEDLFHTGTTARVLRVVKLPEAGNMVIVHGKERFQIQELTRDKGHFSARVQALHDSQKYYKIQELEALSQSIKEVAGEIAELRSDIPELQSMMKRMTELDFLTYFLASNISMDVAHKQSILETTNKIKQAKLLLGHLLKQLKFVKLKREIQQKVYADIADQQREWYLRRQIKVLQSELGDADPGDEVNSLREKAARMDWNEEVAEHVDKTLARLANLHPHMPEYATLVDHTEILLSLPWKARTDATLDLDLAEKILDKHHYGIKEVKERILEYLAVYHLKKNLRGKVICLLGPYGVGKTTLCKSIAKAFGRRYAHISLSGVHDEAEIRGHRMTYVNAMPGRCIQAMQKIDVIDPVLVLDEIDKMRDDLRGSPSAALLEVLDPEQNMAFKDNFLQVPFDLSKVFFIATANTLDNIPPALRDRMAVVEIPGYTLEEKLQIAKRHLIPRQRREHGLRVADIAIQDKALVGIVENYTDEAGVRELERKIGNLMRKAARSIVMQRDYAKKIDRKALVPLLGAGPFDKDIYKRIALPGVAIGLAWTSTGGEILFIESSLARGKGELTISGQLGDVMEESAIAALSCIKSKADELGINHKVFKQYDLHIHVPDGATPKDGPSAGITLFAALASLYTQRKVRDSLAMTGEITLRGAVLPVGGVKNKISAARHAGIKTIILSKRNEKDVREIQKEYTKGLEFHYADHVDDVLRLALQKRRIDHAKRWNIYDRARVAARP